VPEGLGTVVRNAEALFRSRLPAARATWVTLSGARKPCPERARIPSVPKISPIREIRIKHRQRRIKGKGADRGFSFQEPSVRAEWGAI